MGSASPYTLRFNFVSSSHFEAIVLNVFSRASLKLSILFKLDFDAAAVASEDRCSQRWGVQCVQISHVAVTSGDAWKQKCRDLSDSPGHATCEFGYEYTSSSDLRRCVESPMQ